MRDEPIVVHCYTTPADIEDVGKLAKLGDFCRRMGRAARQGEVGLVVRDEYCAIRDFAEEETMKRRPDMDKIARGLGAERRGKVPATGDCVAQPGRPEQQERLEGGELWRPEI